MRGKVKTKFSDLISELSDVWWSWMKSDKVARSSDGDYNHRRYHAEKCESLIRREYQIIDQINSFFKDVKIEKTGHRKAD
jgi:hypothetical protein